MIVRARFLFVLSYSPYSIIPLVWEESSNDNMLFCVVQTFYILLSISSHNFAICPFTASSCSSSFARCAISSSILFGATYSMHLVASPSPHKREQSKALSCGIACGQPSDQVHFDDCSQISFSNPFHCLLVDRTKIKRPAYGQIHYTPATVWCQEKSPATTLAGLLD